MEFQSDNVQRIDRNGNLWFNSGESNSSSKMDIYLKNEQRKRLLLSHAMYISIYRVNVCVMCGWVCMAAKRF